MKRHTKRFHWRFLIFLVVVSVICGPIGQVLAQEATPTTEPNSTPSDIVAPTPQTTQNSDTTSPPPEISPNTQENKSDQTNATNDATVKTETTPQDVVSPPPTDPGVVPFNLAPPANIKQSLPGIDVASGALTYAYPFRLPQGRRGMQPDLSLSYNSQNNEEGSLFGFGWNLSIPTIERKNLNGTDKLYTSLDFASSLDSDLKYVSGSGNSVIFGAKIDNSSFISYTFHDQSNGGSWTAQTKQGVIYTFGGNTTSKLNDPNDTTKVFRWYLTKITDPVGNFVSFQYSKVNEQVYPDSISYTNFAQETGIFSVVFTLENRPDTALDAKPGFVVHTTKRIQKIQSYIGSNVVGKYELSYEQAPINGRSRLSQVQFTGYDSNNQPTVEPATLFSYDSISATGLLTEITQATGGTTSVTYKPSAQYRDTSGNLLNPRLPFVMYTVEQIEYNDGNSVVWHNNFEYSGGWFYYNGPFDRHFVGFERVVKTDANDNKTISYYHQGNGDNTGYGEVNDNQGKAGKMYKLEQFNNSDVRYERIVNTWATVDLGNDRTFVKLSQSLEQTFDGNTSRKDKAASYTYNNANGNVTQKIEWGEVDGNINGNGTFTDVGTDKFITDYSYAVNTNGDVYALSSELTNDQNSVKVSETHHYYDSLPLGQLSVGNETKTEQWRSGTKSINTQKTYNSYGLVSSDIDPRGKTTSYTFDSHNLYPATTTNALNQTMSFAYDYSSGNVVETIDQNSHAFYTDYDGLDRPIAERQPDPANPNLSVAKTSYEYVDTPNAVRIKKINYLDASNSVESYTYFDGLGRKLQERNEAAVATHFNVRDFVYTADDLLLKESLPYDSTNSAKTSPTTTTALYTNYSYDTLKRVLTTTVADNWTTTNTYDDWKTTVTDADGKIKDLYRDAYDNLIQVDEHNNSSTYTTTYEWTGLKKLKKITDALGNIRNFTYDGLGRVLTAEDLHAPADTTFGVWYYSYDATGNLVSRTDPNSQVVGYSYDDINRILTEDYAATPAVDVTYTYDTCTEGVGRLCSVVNSTLSVANTFNALGQLIAEMKTIDGAKYQMQYTYDRLGNQILIINPDSSRIQYIYNAAGSVGQVQRKEKTDFSFTDVISSIDYNPVNLITTLTYANGAVTTNTYDDAHLYRLSHKVTFANYQSVQDLTYSYDAVGNILQIVDASNTQTAKTTDYTYDDLHRLLTATISNAAINLPDDVQSYTYDAIGNILSKSDVGNYSYDGNQGNSYANPHAVTTAGGTTYSYDNNGNLTSAGFLTGYSWDYNNHLTQVTTGLPSYSYFYDASGQRVKFTSSQGTTVEPTQGYSVTNNIAEKHIFLGDQAIATIQGSGSQAAIFDIHADHLTGSNVVTDASQNTDELMDYYGFGTIRIDSQSGSLNEIRKFSGHEFSFETGLSYANARYYNAKLGRWLSQDPVFLMLGNPQKVKEITQLEYPEYLSTPQSMNAYTYVSNNPLKYKDVKGESEWYAWAFNPVSTLGQISFWENVSSGLQLNHWNTSAAFLERSLSLHPGALNIDRSNDQTGVINKIKQSSEYQNIIDSRINSANKNGETSFGLNTGVKFESNKDLMGSIHKAEINIQGQKDDQGNWAMNVGLNDTYNFEYGGQDYSSRNTSIFSTGANAATYSYNAGVISKYDISIKFLDNKKK